MVEIGQRNVKVQDSRRVTTRLDRNQWVIALSRSTFLGKGH